MDKTQLKHIRDLTLVMLISIALLTLAFFVYKKHFFQRLSLASVTSFFHSDNKEVFVNLPPPELAPIALVAENPAPPNIDFQFYHALSINREETKATPKKIPVLKKEITISKKIDAYFKQQRKQKMIDKKAIDNLLEAAK